MYDDLLVPTDGSDTARRALEEAIELSKATGADLHVLHALEVGELPPEIDTDEVEEAFEYRGQRAVNEAVERAEEEGVENVYRAVLRGQPHEAILEYADDHDVDLIVVGTHGRTGLDRLIVGSVAEKVVRLAEVPVMTVRDDE